MTIADCKRARKRIIQRYSPGKRRSVHAAIEAERNAAKRSQRIVRKVKTK